MICNACPRRCGAERTEYSPGGICACPCLPLVARAAPHYGEEPCISGSRGSGAVFFSGCNLKCVFCQNHEISRARIGKTVSIERLADIFLELRDKGVHNINLVTPTHYTDAIVKALERARLDIPVVWNSSGYECVETLHMLDGLVQVYLPDLKYALPEPAARYSAAADYPQVARAAILEMYRQTGPYVLDESGMLRSGVLIRHLILPGRSEDAMNVIDFAADEFPRGSVLFSLMSQYTPMPGLEHFPELSGRIDSETNSALTHYMSVRHLDGFWQEPDSATAEMILAFDGTGV